MKTRLATSHHADAGPDDAAPLVRLWLLRMLTQLQLSAPWDRFSLDAQLCAALDLHLPDLEDRALSDKRLRADLRRLHGRAETAKHTAHTPVRIAENVRRLAALVGLSPVDCRILEFAVMLASERVLDDAADKLGSLSTRRTWHALSVILDLPEATVRVALDRQGALARSGLLVLERSNACTLSGKLNLLSDRFADHVAASEADPIELLRETVAPSTPGHLALADFEHVASSTRILKPYLARALQAGRRGVNVLIHGSPGTGKNQFVKALAAELGCPLYEVSSEDSEGDLVDRDQRLRAYRAAQSVLAALRVLLLFDEVQDVFDSPDRPWPDRSTPQGGKAWINRTLENNPVPALWLTNSIAGLDAAHVRRFDMVIEMPVPPRKQREKIVRDTCSGLLDEPGVALLAGCEALAPAVVARAADVVAFVDDGIDGSWRQGAVEQLVDQTLQAQGHAGLRIGHAPSLPGFYDPAFVNVDADLAAIAAGLQDCRCGRICLYGPPGTGKTAWARWLAQQVDAPLHVHRASDLLGMFVGENEKNIARAFRRAAMEGAVLLIDEVDSFLRDRQSAVRGWEASLVNEMLTQMESFDGIFIASTNLMDGLDAAALRRFDLKLQFGHLHPKQAAALLGRHAAAMALAPPDEASTRRLRRLDRLTPGDFAVVARQHRLQSMRSCADVVTSLEREVALKRQGTAQSIGFI